jgi:hypothetical protein
MAGKNSEFANTSEVSEQDAVLLDSPTGREDHLGMTEASSLVAGEINKPIGARPKGEETGRHDAGSGANETIDGLDSLAEATRKGAEELTDVNERKDVPVFDRGRMI